MDNNRPDASLTTYQWEAILKRLQSISTEYPVGPAMVEIRMMLLDSHPVMWFEPSVQRLEPKRSGLQFLGLLCDQIQDDP